MGRDWAIRAEPQWGGIGNNREDACLVEGAKVLLREAANRVRENPETRDRSLSTITQDIDVGGERKLSVEEDAQPVDNW